MKFLSLTFKSSAQKNVQFRMIRINSLNVLFFVCMLFLGKNALAFRCDNGQIISDDKFCNRIYDCGDLSDEQLANGCTKRGCRAGKFTCQLDKNCISIKKRCDAINDCDDDSDEVNCGDRSHIGSPGECKIDQEKFLCKNNLACIDFSLTCDGRCHCIDCSDENVVNCTKFDSTSCSSCIESCLPTPDGPSCFCNSPNNKSSPICKKIQNCTQHSHECSQHCTRYGNFQRCLCYEGFHEVRDTNGNECRRNFWLQTVVLYSTVTKIKLVNFSTDAIELILNDVRCTALAASRDNVYYAEFRNNRASIRKTLITGDGIPEEIVQLGSQITSVSVDWITENVYFTSNKSLYVCASNGRICTQLKCCGINEVVLAPKHGIMFYTQYVLAGEDDQLVMKSNMDGSEERTLLPDECFSSPTSIAFDEYEDKLYVLEKRLYSFSLDGMNKNEHLQFIGKNELYFSVLNERAFIAEQHNNAIYGEDLYRSKTLRPTSTVQYPDNSTSYVRHLFLHSPGLQRTAQVENICSDAPCTGLCVTRLLSNGLNYTCLCEDFTPSEDNHWCDKDEQYSSQRSKSIITSTSRQPHSESTSNTDYSSTTIKLFSEETSTPDEVDVSPSAVPPTDSYQTAPLDESPTSLSKTYDYVVIYSTATKIKAWYVANDTHRVIQTAVQITALAGVRGDIYYGSIDKQSHIFKINMESGETKELVRIETRIASISVDWITNNIYFTSNGSLSVCSPDGSICTQLKCCGIGHVVVTPLFQWMFYTQKMISDDKYLIMRSGLDGSEENILLDGSFLGTVSLTVDESNETVYWSDREIGSYMLHFVSFTGGRKQMAEVFYRTSSKYSNIAALEGNLFYVNEDQQIMWQNPHWSRSYQDTESNTVKMLHAFSPALQNADGIKNPCNQLPCPTLCLLSPTLSTNIESSTCICENFTPTDENHWCEDHPVLEPKSSTARRIEVPTSTEPITNSTPKQMLRSEDCSLVSVIAESTRTLQSDYLVASGVIGFIMGMMSTSFVMGVCLVCKKINRERNRMDYLINREMAEIEM